MKITKTQLKEIIKEEASKIQKKTILEDRKKDIIRELGTLSEGEGFDVDLTTINLSDTKSVASLFLAKAIDSETFEAEEMNSPDINLSTNLKARYINDNGEEVIFPLSVRASLKYWEDADPDGRYEGYSLKEFYSVLECDDEFFEKHEDLHEIEFPLDDLVNSDGSYYLEDLAKREAREQSDSNHQDSFKSLGMSMSDFLEETKNVSKKKTILENKKKSSKSKLKLKKITILENRKKAIIREMRMLNEDFEEFVPEVGMIAGNQTDGLGYKGTIEHVGEDYFVLRNTKGSENGPILIEKSRYKQFKDWGYHLPDDENSNAFDNMMGNPLDNMDFLGEDSDEIGEGIGSMIKKGVSSVKKGATKFNFALIQDFLSRYFEDKYKIYNKENRIIGSSDMESLNKYRESKKTKNIYKQVEELVNKQAAIQKQAIKQKYSEYLEGGTWNDVRNMHKKDPADSWGDAKDGYVMVPFDWESIWKEVKASI